MPNTTESMTLTNPFRIKWHEALLDWLGRNARYVLMAGVAFQLVVLVWMIVVPANVLLTGQTVLLRTRPVDPRDLFRGDYVILSYDFSSIPPDVAGRLNRGEQELQDIYVTLQPEEDGLHWLASDYSLYKPEGVLFIKGRVSRWNRAEFGIESYFVQEGKGLEYEKAIRDQKLSAEVAIDAEGTAALKNLIIE
jgi:uncharacterized membrane-anchored protein